MGENSASLVTLFTAEICISLNVVLAIPPLSFPVKRDIILCAKSVTQYHKVFGPQKTEGVRSLQV
jgi:hypothetical protein